MYMYVYIYICIGLTHVYVCVYVSVNPRCLLFSSLGGGVLAGLGILTVVFSICRGMGGGAAPNGKLPKRRGGAR